MSSRADIVDVADLHGADGTEREGTTLVKPQVEVRLEKTERNIVSVTKYSWR